MSLVAELFARARRLPPRERERLLAERCAGDAALRAEVLSLLAAHDASLLDTGGFARPVQEVAAHALGSERDGGDPVPERVGPFRVVGILGEGGMGTVYEAEQLEPVQRRVALKVIRGGMASRDVLARFEAERQALALMDHPHVASVLEAGSTDDGRPWFAMELVHGVPITEHCDARRLDVTARLRLFLAACHGVQHAHHAGLVHRDIKPANLLVEEHDGRPLLKVIDFGIAKAVGAGTDADARLTQAGLAIGTPAYMSPEQARGAEHGVDTRTDVYSLGVVLYELLTGCLPAAGTPSRTWLEQLARGEAEAPAPSARVLSLPREEAERVARARGTTPRALARRLAGDLDGIALRAMEADRARRYETASALAADVQRHLDDEPVEARPPSLAYRAAKLVRKHRATAVAAASLVGALAIVAITSAIQSVRLARERDAARDAQAVAEAESRAARQVAGLMERVFALSDPAAPRRDDLTVRELLDRGTQAVRSELGDQPLIRARLLASLGRVHDGLGLYDAAGPLLREALEIRRSHLPAAHPDMAESLNDLGRLALHVRDLGEARRLHEEALAAARASLPPGDPRITVILSNLAVDLHESGDVRAALPSYEEVLAARRRDGSPADVAAALTNFGAALAEIGQLERAQALHEEALELSRRALGPRHVAVGRSLMNVAMVRRDLGDVAGARAAAEEAVAIHREALGPDHPELGACLNNLGLIVADAGDLPAAKTLHAEALEIERRALGADHPQVAACLNNLALVESELGDAASAEAHLREALAIQRARSGTEAEVAMTLGNLALVLVARGELEGARDLLQQSVALRRLVLDESDPSIADDLADLANVVSRIERDRPPAPRDGRR